MTALQTYMYFGTAAHADPVRMSVYCPSMGGENRKSA